MSEYRRVLHKWAERYTPEGATVTKVTVRYDEGYDPTYGGYGPRFEVDIEGTSSEGRAFYKTLFGDYDTEVDTSLGGMLTALFAIANAEEGK